ncbi:MAG: peroxiredoxin [Deltaproteobacteria bacterium]|nr:peroxiredoxin [Deltaproteobacteria bacterium]
MRIVLAVACSVLVTACSKESPPPAPTGAAAASTAATPAAPPVASAAAATPSAAPSAPAAAEEIAVGKPAPDFSVKAHDGTDIKISALGGKPVVLYFYPRDETPGCTKEACSFRDAWKDLAKTKVVLVGVSTDNAESHKAFAKHHELPFHLVSDENGAIAKAYGVPNRGGFLARHTIVVGADGMVKKIYREVDVSKHAAEVLADVKG